MKKIATIIGARPQFIKAATVSRTIRSTFKEVLVHTGQHYDFKMSGIFFEELDIPEPDYNLEIGSGPHGRQTGSMLAEIEDVLCKEAPDAVLVYGDTNSTLAGALAAAKLHIPVIHVEAGLRSFNKEMPEEINRIVADHVSALLFAPTESAKQNLLREGIDPSGIHVVGDVMYDAARYYSDRAEKKGRKLSAFGVESGTFILATVHRAENTDNRARLMNIFNALNTVSKQVPVVVPLHPRTRKILDDMSLATNVGLHLIEPVGYLDMIVLEKNAAVIATDSGGIQKEAYFYGVPCVTLRNETEWVELVESGWNTLVSPDSEERIVDVVLSSIGKKGKECSLYGNGDASEKIASVLLSGNLL